MKMNNKFETFKGLPEEKQNKLVKKAFSHKISIESQKYKNALQGTKEEKPEYIVFYTDYRLSWDQLD
jgi:hypothetical protein